MSSASSNQSFVREGAGYEELYPSGYKDPAELIERTPSATSPSSTNEDMELAEPEEENGRASCRERVFLSV